MQKNILVLFTRKSFFFQKQIFNSLSFVGIRKIYKLRNIRPSN